MVLTVSKRVSQSVPSLPRTCWKPAAATTAAATTAATTAAATTAATTASTTPESASDAAPSSHCSQISVHIERSTGESTHPDVSSATPNCISIWISLMNSGEFVSLCRWKCVAAGGVWSSGRIRTERVIADARVTRPAKRHRPSPTTSSSRRLRLPPSQLTAYSVHRFITDIFHLHLDCALLVGLKKRKFDLFLL